MRRNFGAVQLYDFESFGIPALRSRGIGSILSWKPSRDGIHPREGLGQRRMDTTTTIHRLVPDPTLGDDQRRFRDELINLGGNLNGDLILDITEVKRLDSTMLGTLALFAKLLPAGSRMVLVGANPTVRTVLMVTRFDAVIPVAETEHQAREMLRRNR